jgi:predicted membrane protein
MDRNRFRVILLLMASLLVVQFAVICVPVGALANKGPDFDVEPKAIPKGGTVNIVLSVYTGPHRGYPYA